MLVVWFLLGFAIALAAAGLLSPGGRSNLDVSCWILAGLLWIMVWFLSFFFDGLLFVCLFAKLF